MEDIIGYLLIFLLALVVAVYVCWILLAALLRVIAWVVFYWCIAFSFAAAGGLITGFVISLRVLSGKSITKPDIATPAEVVANHVIKHAPRGFAKRFGWDRAWPEYNPYQAQRDADAVRTELRLLLSAVWGRVSGKVRKRALDTSGAGVKKVGGITASVFKTVPGIIWGTFVPIPYVGFFLGAWVSFAIWLLAMLVIGGAVYLCQQAFTLGYRWFDRGRLSRIRASVKCPECYGSYPRPIYRCLNEACAIMHHEISPGPLGVIHRRCECGTSLPTTVGAASKVLVALCPGCGAELSEGSGARRTIQLPAFGSVGAGKTRLFAAALASTSQQLMANSGSVEPLTAEAAGFLKASTQEVRSGIATNKTIPTMRPEGHPIKLTDAVGRVLELQLMDAAGESFTSLQATEELIYVNSAPTMIFVFDPLALPRIQMEMVVQRDLPSVVVAAGSQEDAYGSVVDRIRSEDVELSHRHLAVVLTKTAILRQLPSGESLEPSTSEGVRDWLISQEQDGFIRRMESDFGDVHYFAIDSLALRDLYDPLNPLRIFQWALQTQKVPITLVPPPVTQPDAAAAEPEEVEVQ